MITKDWQPLIDLTNLRELTDNDKVMMVKYINIFTIGLPAHLLNVQTGINLGDTQLIYQTLHILKSQIELMGIYELVPLIQTSLTDLKNQTVLTVDQLTELQTLLDKLNITKLELNTLITQLNDKNENG